MTPRTAQPDNLIHDALPMQGTHELIDALHGIRRHMLQSEAAAASILESIPAERLPSARNLLHYIALRSQDIRQLQEQLVTRGLSSLGRCEAYVLANVEAVLQLLGQSSQTSISELPAGCIPTNFTQGRDQLRNNTQSLFADIQSSRPFVMATMPTEAASDYALIRDLLVAGMNVMRINCAHDDPTIWTGMIENLRRAEAEVGTRCCVSMDLAGPKIRTGTLPEAPAVLSWKPKRDQWGRVTAPAEVWIRRSDRPDEAIPNDSRTVIASAESWWELVQAGDYFRFTDTAGRTRKLAVVEVTQGYLRCESAKSAYIGPETLFTAYRPSGSASKDRPLASGTLGPLPPQSARITVFRDELLIITSDDHRAEPEVRDPTGALCQSARIGCTLPQVFRDVQVGDRVLFDDGKIAGVVREADGDEITVEITRARDTGDKLRANKGLNFPNTDLKLPALTEKDMEDLEFVTRHADVVNYSFVRRPEDIQDLQHELRRLGRTDIGVVLKIENTQAFNNLPLLLLESMRYPAATGVMIARGDLAVECGWERLVEVQEEILWMAEAAHMPVVWATQVLEGMAKSGFPTRAEVTDAGMGGRAECVMLNKGPNIVETVETLHDILHRMQQHQAKKRATFRQLHVADQLLR